MNDVMAEANASLVQESFSIVLMRPHGHQLAGSLYS